MLSWTTWRVGISVPKPAAPYQQCILDFEMIQNCLIACSMKWNNMSCCERGSEWLRGIDHEGLFTSRPMLHFYLHKFWSSERHCFFLIGSFYLVIFFLCFFLSIILFSNYILYGQQEGNTFPHWQLSIWSQVWFVFFMRFYALAKCLSFQFCWWKCYKIF